MTSEEIIHTWDGMAAEMNSVRPRIDAVRKYFTPWRQSWQSYGNSGVTAAGANAIKPWAPTESVAILAAQQLGAAFLHWLCSPNDPWLQFKPGNGNSGADTVADTWAVKLREMLANSNFYDTAQDMLLGRVVDGTGAHVAEWDDDTDSLRFEFWPALSFGFSLRANGTVSCVIRQISYTAEQAVQKFGKGLPKDIAEAASRATTKTQKFAFLHCLYWRDPKKIDPKSQAARSPRHMPVASVHLVAKDKVIVREGGMWTMPVAVSRYARMALTDTEESIWGASPAMNVLSSAAALQDLSAAAIKVAKVMADPRILVSTMHQGPVDLRPAGVTRVEDMNLAPREWATGANLNGLEGLMQRFENTVREGMMSRLVNQFGSVTKQMTAQEVIAKQREALIMFGSPVGRTVSEWLRPMVQAAFVLAFDAGAFGDFPDEMRDANGSTPMPQVVFSSKIMQALDEMAEAGFISSIQDGAGLMQISPGVLNVLDINEGFRRLCRSKGVSPDIIRSREKVAEIEAQQAQAQQQAMQQEAVAKLASNPGTIKAVSEAMGGAQ
jgi:hypothetical protein